MTRSSIAGSVRSTDDRLALATEPIRRRRGGGGGPVTASPLASGRTADVYALDGDRVLRRYRSGGDVRAEADLMRHLHAHSYPVPGVHHADGPDLVLDRVTGPTLVEASVSGVVEVGAAARLLVDLHDRLHALPALRSTGPGTRILHLDLHPLNVLLAADGPVVIDWANAAEGPPELDRAMTAVILAEVAVDRSHPLSALAGDLLMAYLAEIGPVVALDPAVALRADTGTLDVGLLPEAAALVRSVTARIRPPLPAARVQAGGGAAPWTVWGVGPAGTGAAARRTPGGAR
ncbi:phosphotransferase [Micromonospora sp. MS34]|uniref:phosphotransferase n=1 Tax=Micromonospora sp. MS34 TaxID=3385971 RepID=UPI00399F797B